MKNKEGKFLSSSHISCTFLVYSTMNRILFAVFIVLLSVSVVSARIHKHHKDNIDKVNKYFANKARMHRPGASWQAGENDLTERDPEELKSLCGTVPLTRKQARSSYHPPPYSDYDSKKRIVIDPQFDASVKWPQCTSIKQARNQETCGSCWAFAGAETISDRYCIASGGTKTKSFSTQDMVVCSGGSNVNYCATGNLARAPYIMMVTSGVVSETCMPYTSGPSAAAAATSTSQCTHTCTNTTSGLDYAADKSYGTTWYEMGNYFTSNTGGAAAGLGESVIRQIQYELMTRGPATTQFKVYEDFYAYKSGVYQHVAGGVVGDHALKLIGWGTENGTDYWLAMNSWGPSWGMNGAAKIVRGINHMGIEDYVVTGMVDPNLTVPQSNLSCDLAGCQGRPMYAISSADTCSMGYCACNYYVGVWNATTNGWDWALSPRVASCDDGKAFDASGSVSSCVDKTLLPACSTTPAITTTSTSTTTPTTVTSTITPTTTALTTTTMPTAMTSSTTRTTTTSTITTTPATVTNTPSTTTTTAARPTKSTPKPTATSMTSATTTMPTTTSTSTTTAKPTTTQITTTSMTSTTTRPTTTALTTLRRRVPVTTVKTTPTTTASTTPRRRVPLTTSQPTTTTRYIRPRRTTSGA